MDRVRLKPASSVVPAVRRFRRIRMSRLSPLPPRITGRNGGGERRLPKTGGEVDLREHV
jgi:hypothetical protein